MVVKRLVASIGVIFLGLSLAAAAQAQNKFSVVGGGGQLHIGNGLAVPIQQAALGAIDGGCINSGMCFPGDNATAFNLLVPVVGKPVITGTVANPSVMAGGKTGYQRRLAIQPGILSKVGSQKTIGVKFSNDVAIAVGTNLNYLWPSPVTGNGQLPIPGGKAIFSTGAAIGGAGTGTVMTGSGFNIGSLVYSNPLGKRFGGAAQFALTGNAGQGLLNGVGTTEEAPVTVYITIGAIDPPGTPTMCCPGTGAAGLVAAVITGNAGPGGALTTVNTPGILLAPNLVGLAFGATPSGTVLGPHPPTVGAFVGTAALPTNAATSFGAQWTTGRIVAKNGRPSPDNETFTLTGRDDRTVLGGGTIQMVSGAVSNRVATKENADRGWVKLHLNAFALTPVLGPMAQIALGGLIVLAGGYVARRKFAQSA